MQVAHLQPRVDDVACGRACRQLPVDIAVVVALHVPVREEAHAVLAHLLLRPRRRLEGVATDQQLLQPPTERLSVVCPFAVVQPVSPRIAPQCATSCNDRMVLII
jgi:hypothetical protein